jgi:hypothetical protein
LHLTPGSGQAAWMQQEMATALLSTVRTHCQAAGIPFLVVKGAVTSRLLYADVADRPISDVDIRIRANDFWRWKTVAREWRDRTTNVVWTYRSRAYAFPSIGLDVECDIGPPGFCALDVGTMLARAEPCSLAPRLTVLVPEIHDHALLLVVNALKDRFAVGNPWALVDLERIVEHPRFDHRRFVGLARCTGLCTAALIVANCMSARFARSGWEAVRRELEHQPALRRRYARLYERVAKSSLSDSLPAYVLAVLASDARSRQALSLATTTAWLAERRVRAWTKARRIG